MARSRGTQALAAGTGRISRGGRADQSASHFRSHEAVSVVGGRERADPKRDILHRADAVAADAALQQERESDDREAVPHPLDFGRAFAEEAGAFGGASEPWARASGHPATERYLEMPPMRRNGRSSYHRKSWPGMPAMHRPRRSRIFACRGCAAHAPGQGKKREARRGGTLQQKPTPL